MMKQFLSACAVFLGCGMLFCGCSGTFGAPAQEGTTAAVEDEQYISFGRIPVNAVYSADTTVGGEFELKLGEDPANGILWKIVAYTLPQCLVRIEHDRDGFWPFICSKAEIKVIPKKRGVSSVTLQCKGKTANILVNAL